VLRSIKDLQSNRSGAGCDASAFDGGLARSAPHYPILRGRGLKIFASVN